MDATGCMVKLHCIRGVTDLLVTGDAKHAAMARDMMLAAAQAAQAIKEAGYQAWRAPACRVAVAGVTAGVEPKVAGRMAVDLARSAASGVSEGELLVGVPAGGVALAAAEGMVVALVACAPAISRASSAASVALAAPAAIATPAVGVPAGV